MSPAALLALVALAMSPALGVPSARFEPDDIAFSQQLMMSYPEHLGNAVVLPYGSFQGSTSGNVTSFLGMPYAQSPVGNLRFAPPRAPEVFKGIRQATSYGPGCPQQGFPPLPEYFMSEDCLSINVVKPASAAAKDKLPVLFWIYGGAFETGRTSYNDGSLIVKRSIELGEPVIFVSHNYRVNAFGFLAGQEMLDANATNVGLRDQRFALEWVQKHISKFGGDPDKVIIWGESAGSLSVAMHLTWNDGDSGGLFRGAVMQSGFPRQLKDISTGQPYYDQLVTSLGCSGEADTLACLRAAPYEDLFAAVRETPSVFSYQSLNLVWEPRIDGDVVRRTGLQSVKKGLYAKVPMIMGDCNDEGTLFSLTTSNITTDEEFLTYIHKNYIEVASHSQIKAVGKAYTDNPTLGSPFNTGHQNHLTPQFKRLAAFNGDWHYQAPRRYFIQAVSKVQDAWAFIFARGQYTPFLGSFHASDLAEFFGGEDYIGMDILVNFANHLDPNAPAGLPKGVSHLSKITWEQWGSNVSAPPMLTFVDGSGLVEFTADTYRKEAMSLLTELGLLFP